jgi:hypothetical protein
MLRSLERPSGCQVRAKLLYMCRIPLANFDLRDVAVEHVCVQIEGELGSSQRVKGIPK